MSELRWFPEDPRPLTRRDWLATTAAASALAVCGGSLARGQAATKRVLVGAHPWVYAATQPKTEIFPILDRIFADMAYAGMDGIELMHNALLHDDAVPTISGLIEKHHLPVLGTSYGATMWDRAQHKAILAEARVLIPRLGQLGGKTLGTSVGGTPTPKTPEQLDAQAEVIKALMKIAADHGVVLNLHNHTYEVEHNLHDLKGTLARVPDVKLGPDLNWLLRGGVDPPTFIRQYGDRIVFLHLRDQKADGKWSEAMGEGDMDYHAIGKALDDIHFHGHAMIELAHEGGFKLTRPLRDSLKMSREYVRQTLGF
jgi:sugar phosphate isomerase/epimerase